MPNPPTSPSKRCPECKRPIPHGCTCPPPSAEETQRYIRICRNPHEPFYWDADRADEPCPSGECQGTEAEHETWVPEARAVQAERALELAGVNRCRCQWDDTGSMVIEECGYHSTIRRSLDSKIVELETRADQALELRGALERLADELDRLAAANSRLTNPAANAVTRVYEQYAAKLRTLLNQPGESE